MKTGTERRPPRDEPVVFRTDPLFIDLIRERNGGTILFWAWLQNSKDTS